MLEELMSKKKRVKQIFVLLHSEMDDLMKAAEKLAKRLEAEVLATSSRTDAARLLATAGNLIAVIARPWIFCGETREHGWASEVCNKARSAFNSVPIFLTADLGDPRAMNKARAMGGFPDDVVEVDDTGGVIGLYLAVTRKLQAE